MSDIRALRQTTGLTQQKFADLLGIPKRTIENWESGKSRPPEYVVRLIGFFLSHREEADGGCG